MKSQKYRIIFIILVLIGVFYSTLVIAAEWSGIDESVVEKVAKEHGREAMPPIINTDQGDLLLFVFLLAGTVGGFTGGYYWRMLMVEKEHDVNSREQKINV